MHGRYGHGYPGALGRHYHYTPGMYGRQSYLRGLPIVGKLLDKLPASAHNLVSKTGAVKLGSAIGAQAVSQLVSSALKGYGPAMLSGPKVSVAVDVAVDVAVGMAAHYGLTKAKQPAAAEIALYATASRTLAAKVGNGLVAQVKRVAPGLADAETDLQGLMDLLLPENAYVGDLVLPESTQVGDHGELVMDANSDISALVMPENEMSGADSNLF